jgi:hypothetical protein
MVVRINILTKKKLEIQSQRIMVLKVILLTFGINIFIKE